MMTYPQAYDALKNRIKAICDRVNNPALPITIRGASNQKLTEQYIQLWIRNWDMIGSVQPIDQNKTALTYEVIVEIGVHRPNTSTTPSGSTMIALNRILHGFKAHSATYLDSFADNDISFLRCGGAIMRHWPIDRGQLEERSNALFVFEVVVVEEDKVDVGYIENVTLTTKVKACGFPTEESITEITYP